MSSKLSVTRTPTDDGKQLLTGRVLITDQSPDDVIPQYCFIHENTGVAEERGDFIGIANVDELSRLKTYNDRSTEVIPVFGNKYLVWDDFEKRVNTLEEVDIFLNLLVQSFEGLVSEITAAKSQTKYSFTLI